MCPRKAGNPPYQKSMLDAAIKAVTSGKFTSKQASTVYGVPATTIGNHIRKKGTVTKKIRDPVNLVQVDEQVIEWLKLMAEIGCFSLKNQLGDIVKEVFERHGFKENLSGDTNHSQWTDRFITRHPEIPEVSIKSEYICSGISASHIQEWTAKQQRHLLQTYKLAIGNFAIEENASRIYSCFEIGSVFRSSNKMASKLIYKPSQSQVEGEFMMSLYSCVCADGTFLKPVAIVKNEKLTEVTMETGVKSFHILSNSEGQMSCEAAMLWLQLIDVEIKPKNGTTSVLIYLDQAIRPLSLATLDFCRQCGLMLYYLPGHYPNMKLPFGMDVFYNLNGEYDSMISSVEAKFSEMTVDITLDMLMDAWKLMLDTNSPITEFLDFGLVPHDMESMKNTVEAIVPITQSPIIESAPELQESAEIPGSSAHAPQTPKLDVSSASIISDSSFHSPKAMPRKISRRPTRIAPKNYKEISDPEDSVEESANNHEHMDSEAQSDADKNKNNLKIKIKRSERIPNNYSIEHDGTNQNHGTPAAGSERNSGNIGNSRTVDSCNKCEFALNDGLRSGVVQGLVFALKRIESSLRADTLDLFKSRYLSPYLIDHRPTEPSFMMWCELMKCLEMGPDAVHKDFIISRTMQRQEQLVNAANRDKGGTIEKSELITSSNNSNSQGEILLTNQASRSNNIGSRYCSNDSGYASRNVSINSLMQRLPDVTAAANQIHFNPRSQNVSRNEGIPINSVHGGSGNASLIHYSNRQPSSIMDFHSIPNNLSVIPNHKPFSHTSQLAHISNAGICGSNGPPPLLDNTNVRLDLDMNQINVNRKPSLPLYHNQISSRDDHQLYSHSSLHTQHKINMLRSQNNFSVQTLDESQLQSNQIDTDNFHHDPSFRSSCSQPNRQIICQSVGMLNPSMNRQARIDVTSNFGHVSHHDQHIKANPVACASISQVAPAVNPYRNEGAIHNVQRSIIDIKQNLSDDNSFHTHNPVMKIQNNISQNYTSTPKQSVKESLKNQSTPGSQRHSSSKVNITDSSSEYNFPDTNASNFPNSSGFVQASNCTMKSSFSNPNLNNQNIRCVEESNKDNVLTNGSKVDDARTQANMPYQNYVTGNQHDNMSNEPYNGQATHACHGHGNIPQHSSSSFLQNQPNHMLQLDQFKRQQHQVNHQLMYSTNVGEYPPHCGYNQVIAHGQQQISGHGQTLGVSQPTIDQRQQT